MDTSRPIDPATHNRGQTTLARTVCEYHHYDRPDQWMKVIQCGCSYYIIIVITVIYLIKTNYFTCIL